ncbi:MAG: hypothetical protein HGA19_22195, partial [Oscillochloris sp.]|nr:hypothetical protein [Oscillochloris sp.]
MINGKRIATGIVQIILCALLFIFLAAPSAGVHAAPRQRCFNETGYCVSGAILEYWERNGGLAIFGYPISDESIEPIEGTWSGPIQWFERDRLEDHNNEGKGVLAGRLGANYLEITGRPWQKGIDMPYNPDCVFVDQTGHNMCGMFLIYWNRNGGLERFGYPISDPIEEKIEGQTYWVQYFERRRMELHPTQGGTSYDVFNGKVPGT